MANRNKKLKLKCFKGSPKTFRVLENMIERNPERPLRRLAVNKEYSQQDFEQCFESSIRSSVALMIETTKRQAG